MKVIRIVLNKESWFDLHNQEDTHLPTFVKAIREAGYFENEAAYIPHSRIECIFTLDVEVPTTKPADVAHLHIVPKGPVQ